jgi:hypothetical protein
MQDTYKIMTLNINGIAASSRIRMLEEMLHRNEVDIALIQEVVSPRLQDICHYTSYMNIGTELRGTAILVKQGIMVSEVKRLPSGRGMAAKFRNTWIINIYAPSGAERKNERETFYTTDILHLLPPPGGDMILGGDFNCVLLREDATGQPMLSRALDILVRGLQLVDAWDQKARPIFTHYTTLGATRIDRFYVTRTLSERKTGVETVSAALTDHFAVILRMRLDAPILVMGKGMWRMNVSLLRDKEFYTAMRMMWTKCKLHRKAYPSSVMWWVRNVKSMIKRTFIREEAERRRDRRQMENTYYEAIYEIVASEVGAEVKAILLKKFNAKIMRLNALDNHRFMVDIDRMDVVEDEDPSIFHIIRARKRQQMRLINNVRDDNGVVHTSSVGIVRTFVGHMKKKFSLIPIQQESYERLAQTIITPVPHEANMALDAPITTDELLRAVKKGKNNKAPGADGVCQDFFKVAWDFIHPDLLEVVQQMYTEGKVLDTQRLGMMICIPKTPTPIVADDYRFLTLLNSDVKLMARIMADRMAQWLPTILHHSQHCGLQGKTMLDAVATIREVIANAEHTGQAMCILSLDFQAAFDRISHQYLFNILDRYGFSMQFQRRIRDLYEKAEAIIRINGIMSSKVPIECGIRQGCPLSMILYALCLNPFLRLLDSMLPGIKIGRKGTKTKIVAYADDVTVFLRSQQDIQMVMEAIVCYEQATGARINVKKSLVLALGAWDRSLNVCNVPYHDEIRILGIRFTGTVNGTAEINWEKVVHTIQAQAKDAYIRTLCLAKRIQYVHNYLPARAWFVAQVLPIPAAGIRQIRTAVNWYLWKGAVFRISFATMRRDKVKGGWNLTDIAVKSRVLLFYRLNIQGRREGTITADWMERWGLLEKSENPPDIRRIPSKMGYLRQYLIDLTYIQPQGCGEMLRQYKKRIRMTMDTLLCDTVEPPVMRVTSLWPMTNWLRVWKNIQTLPDDETLKMRWYQLVHDILPTNDRLHRIRLSTTAGCRRCNAVDTIGHRITECGEGPAIWRWTRARIAAILRMDAVYIPETWILRPDFLLWPPKRHRAVLWMLAQMAIFRTQNARTLTMNDYMDFLRRAKWKVYTRSSRMQLVGNYLSALEA